MTRQSQEDTGLQNIEPTDSNIREDIAHMSGFHSFLMRHMGHQEMDHSNNIRNKSLPIVPILLITMVALHVVAAVMLSQTGSAGFSFNNPMSFGMIGLLLIFAISKLKHVLGFFRRRGQQSAEITDSVRSTSREQRQ